MSFKELCDVSSMMQDFFSSHQWLALLFNNTVERWADCVGLTLPVYSLSTTRPVQCLLIIIIIHLYRPGKSDYVISKVLHMVHYYYPARAKHCVIPLWEGATSSHLNSLGSIQATGLPLGMVNLFGMHIIPPLTITARYQFYTSVRWGTHGVHILPKDVTAPAGPSHISHYGAMPAGWSPIHILTRLVIA